ncbi:MAG: hypothetical protein ACJATA_001807 [Sphingobacteriales bacterium]|jgi:hypothetical protein
MRILIPIILLLLTISACKKPDPPKPLPPVSFEKIMDAPFFLQRDVTGNALVVNNKLVFAKVASSNNVISHVVIETHDENGTLLSSSNLVDSIATDYNFIILHRLTNSFGKLFFYTHVFDSNDSDYKVMDLFISYDEGKNWINDTLNRCVNSTTCGTLIDVLDTSNIFMFKSPNLYQSSDLGKTWNVVNTNMQDIGNVIRLFHDSKGGIYVVRAIEYEPINGFGQGYYHALYKSSDDGRTFQFVAKNSNANDVNVPLEGWIRPGMGGDHRFYDNPLHNTQLLFLRPNINHDSTFIINNGTVKKLEGMTSWPNIDDNSYPHLNDNYELPTDFIARRIIDACITQNNTIKLLVLENGSTNDSNDPLKYNVVYELDITGKMVLNKYFFPFNGETINLIYPGNGNGLFAVGENSIYYAD